MRNLWQLQRFYAWQNETARSDHRYGISTTAIKEALDVRVGFACEMEKGAVACGVGSAGQSYNACLSSALLKRLYWA